MVLIFCFNIFRDVLEEGGTAVDGAIAALVCNGAVHSHSMGLGGGFLMTIFLKDKNETHFLNAREVAPSYATKDMFINNNITKANPEKGNQLETVYYFFQPSIYGS